jgi:hypothetical protein
MPLESNFKNKLITEIQKRFPGAIVLKTAANQIQGIPDNLILFGSRWAAFEAKRYIDSPIQPNQEYYVDLLNKMSYASFVYPQNKEEFLNDLQYALRFSR